MSTAARTETWEMVVVHDGFRREFSLLPDLVRGVAAGDQARARLVGEHARLLTDFLHHHHVNEDQLLWPKLLARCPQALDQDLVHRMEAQHAAVADLVERIGHALSAWTASADPAARDRLADLYEELAGPLFAHLAEEEARILPLVERYVSPVEWAQLGKQGARSTPMSKTMLMIGSLMASGGPDTVRFYASLPLPLRAAYRVAGHRSYTRYVTRLQGGTGSHRPGPGAPA